MTHPKKPAPAEFPILDVIQERWSPVGISAKPIDQKTIDTLFEAARWAPSSYNEQSWRFLYATKDDGKDREILESLLSEGNAWAKNPYFLMISFAKKTFTRNGKENRHALHDLGAANFAITLQATSLGLTSHQMSGFDAEHANAILGVPDDFVPGSMMAVGFANDLSDLTTELRERDEKPRVRKTQTELVFHKTWKN